MAKIVVCTNCGKEKEHEAKGLCVTCYGKIGRPQKMCIECKESRPHTAHGLCRQCYNRRRRVGNPEAVRIWNSRYYQKHREECLAANRRWAKENPEKAAAIKSRWKRENPRKVNITTASYRARKKNLLDTLTEEKGAELFLIGQATYPNQKLHLDHVVPISKGGGTTRANVHYIPAILNSSKKGKLPQEVYKQLELWE